VSLPIRQKWFQHEMKCVFWQNWRWRPGDLLSWALLLAITTRLLSTFVLTGQFLQSYTKLPVRSNVSIMMVVINTRPCVGMSCMQWSATAVSHCRPATIFHTFVHRQEMLPCHSCHTWPKPHRVPVAMIAMNQIWSQSGSSAMTTQSCRCMSESWNTSCW